jgi:hypothetical protein
MRNLVVVFCSLLVATVAAGVAQPVASEVAFWLVIDDSPSMDWPGHDPQGLRFDAVRLLIDELEQGNSIAVIGFSSRPQSIFGLTELTAENRRGLKEALARGFPLRSRYWTDIEAALATTLGELEKHANLQNVVVLLSDGEIKLGARDREEASEKRLLEQILPQFVTQNVPIFTIALTRFDTSLLEEIAQKTGGEFYQTTQAEQLPEVIHSIFTKVFGIQSQQLSEDNFTVAPLIDRLKIQLFLPSEDAQVELIDPSGQSHAPARRGQLYALFDVSEPPAGIWRLLVRSTQSSESKPRYEVMAESSLRLDLRVPERISTEESLTAEAAATYRGSPLEPRGKWASGTETVVIGVEFHVDGRFTKAGGYDAERRVYSANLGRLSEGLHDIRAVLRGELHREGSTPMPFEIASEKRKVEVYTKALIAWGELPAELTRHEPVSLKVESKGDLSEASIRANVVLPDGSIQGIELVADGRGRFVARYIPTQTGQYHFVLEPSASYQVEQPEVIVQVVPPRLELVDSGLTFHGPATKELRVRAKLFSPDVAALILALQGSGAKVEVAGETFVLTANQPEISIPIEVRAIDWLARLQRRELRYELTIADVNGVVEPQRVTIPLRILAPFPTREVLSLAALLVALVSTLSWRLIARRRTASSQQGAEKLIPGQEFVFAKPKDGSSLEVAVGRAPTKALNKIVIPREDVAETQFVITVQNGLCKLVPKARLKTYVNRVAALVETELKDGSIIEFGSGSSCSLLFKDEEQQIRFRVIK